MKPPQRSLPTSPTFTSDLDTFTGSLSNIRKRARRFETELSLDPNHAQALAYLGDIEWKDNHPDAALPLLQRAIKANKDLRVAYVDLGAIYLQQKNYKDAQAAISKAIALEPDQPDAHYQLGRLYQATGRSTEAEKELHKVRELREKADSLVGKISPRRLR